MPQIRNPAGRPSRPFSVWRPTLSERSTSPRERFTPPRFVCTVEPARDCVIVRPEGELDMATAPTLEDHIAELRSTGFDHVVVDLSGLTFMDSTGLRLLIQHSHHAAGNGTRFSLIPGDRPIERVFDIAGVRSELEFVERSSLRGE